MFASLLSKEEMQLEEQHLYQVIHSIRYGYRQDCMARLTKYMSDYRSLPPDGQALCAEYPAKLEAIRQCVNKNTIFLQTLTDQYLAAFPTSSTTAAAHTSEYAVYVENCRSMLRQLVREWSEEGAEERSIYGWVIQQIEQHLPAGASVLVPGAGLGRLAWELARRCFSVQGSEFSHFMLLPAEFVLNRLTSGQQVAIHPYCFPLSNIRRAECDQLRPVAIPDVFPVDSDTPDFSMVAGDFLQVYGGDKENMFDGIACCFFLDTAKNVVEYLKCFRQLLKDGGVLVNCGPLLYHFEGSAEEVSIELSWEELRVVLVRLGFEEIEEECKLESSYVQNRCSLLQTRYHCIGSTWRINKSMSD